MTYAEALRQATALMPNIDGAARDARWLLAHACGIPRDRISLVARDDIPHEQAQRLLELAAERASHRPLSHIISGREFFNRWFKITPEVLDPRPETEILVEHALSEPFTKVLDMGVGSGAILVTLLAERPQSRGVGIDVSETGILVAGENAVAHNVADRIVLPLSDWWEDVGGQYDLIVSNPPYIAQSEMGDLSPDVREFEPHDALTDYGDGLGAYRKIAAGLVDHLTPGGRVLLEIGPTQAQAVSRLLADAGLSDIQVYPDLDGRDRVVGARNPA